MKKYLVILLLMLFAGNVTNAQLVRLPDHIQRALGAALSDQLYSVVDSAQQYSFEILVEVVSINKDSALVKSVTQLDGRNSVHYLKDIEFIKRSNFAPLLAGHQTLKIHIPCFYSMINRLREGTSGRGGFDDFVFEFNDLFVREKITAGEIYTAPIYCIGSIYE